MRESATKASSAEQANEWAVWANGWASDPVRTSRFLVVLVHSASLDRWWTRGRIRFECIGPLCTLALCGPQLPIGILKTQFLLHRYYFFRFLTYGLFLVWRIIRPFVLMSTGSNKEIALVAFLSPPVLSQQSITETQRFFVPFILSSPLLSPQEFCFLA